MHEAGSQLWTTQWRDGKIINEIGRIEYWAFDHQLVQAVNILFPSLLLLSSTSIPSPGYPFGSSSPSLLICC